MFSDQNGILQDLNFRLHIQLFVQLWPSKIGNDNGQSFWFNQDLDMLSTSKWHFEPQFCERFSCSCQKNDQKYLKMAIYMSQIYKLLLQNWKNPEMVKFVFYVVAFHLTKI
jgi:hypothetical protein